jgi:hypothetical protein
MDTAAVTDTDGYSPAHYISLLSGALLAVSELLPFLSKVKGNGILQMIIEACSKQREQNMQNLRKEQDQFDAILARLDKLVAIFEEKKSASPQ